MRFFRLEVERSVTGDGKPDPETTTSRVQTVPIGLVMVVHPCVNLDTEEVILTLRPTVSRIVERKNDPAVVIKSDYKVESSVPVVQVREMDSIVTVHSREVIVMGRLIEDNTTSDQSQVPGLHKIPLLCYLFQGKDQEHQMTELVIFLKATTLTVLPKSFPMLIISCTNQALQIQGPFSPPQQPQEGNGQAGKQAPIPSSPLQLLSPSFPS